MSKRNSDFAKILRFMKETEKFKMIERKIPLSSHSRNEDDAQHSWHLAMFIILLQDQFPRNTNVMKMIKLALVHDLGEIYTGDIALFDTKGRIGKEKRELQSAKRLFSILPNKLSKEMLSLVKEYNAAKTPEAKFVKSLDKLQATLQFIASRGQNMVKNGITYVMVDAKKRPYMEHSKKMLELHDIIMSEGKKSKIFAKED